MTERIPGANEFLLILKASDEPALTVSAFRVECERAAKIEAVRECITRMVSWDDALACLKVYLRELEKDSE